MSKSSWKHWRLSPDPTFFNLAFPILATCGLLQEPALVFAWCSSPADARLCWAPDAEKVTPLAFSGLRLNEADAGPGRAPPGLVSFRAVDTKTVIAMVCLHVFALTKNGALPLNLLSACCAKP